MKKRLAFSVVVNIIMLIVIAIGGTYGYMAFKTMEQKIVSVQVYVDNGISNLKESFDNGKKQRVCCLINVGKNDSYALLLKYL